MWIGPQAVGRVDGFRDMLLSPAPGLRGSDRGLSSLGSSDGYRGQDAMGGSSAEGVEARMAQGISGRPFRLLGAAEFHQKFGTLYQEARLAEARVCGQRGCLRIVEPIGGDEKLDYLHGCQDRKSAPQGKRVEL